MIGWLLSKLIGGRFPSREEARDWLALLYVPVLTLCAVGQTVALIVGWPETTAAQRINFLGWGLILNLALIGLGTFFLQRRTVNLRAKTAAGEVEIENVSGPA